MRKITRQLVEKWLAAEFRDRLEYAPFPCKTDKGFPTRIYVRMRFLKGDFFYMGKPSPNVMHRISQLLHRKDWYGYTFAEFDRRGILATWKRGGYSGRDTTGSGYHSFITPRQYIHPWNHGRNFIFQFDPIRVVKSNTSKFALYVNPQADQRRNFPTEYLRLMETAQCRIV